MHFSDHRSFRFRVKDAVKGKVAELLFEHLFKDAGYTVLFMGYEKNLSYLVQTHSVFKSDPKIRVFGKTPDFLLIGRGNYYFVEVKYRTEIVKEELLSFSLDIQKYYPHTRLFLVTSVYPYFYYNGIERIIEHGGEIEEMRYSALGIGRAEFGIAQQLARQYFSTPSMATE